LTIGVLYLDLLVPDARSLKDKRRVIKGLKDRMHGKFNCSVAEIDYQDVWTRCRLAACVVSSDSRHANTQLNEIASFAERQFGAELADYRIEML
jgi:uncharacterized protein YlxP (DUF503 family)